MTSPLSGGRTTEKCRPCGCGSSERSVAQIEDEAGLYRSVLDLGHGLVDLVEMA